jgi:hypothetical protein
VPMIAWVRTSSDRALSGPPSPPGPGVPGSEAPSSWPVPASWCRRSWPSSAAQPDQVFQRAQVDVAGDHRGGRGVAGEPGRGVAVEPGGPVAAGHRGGGAGRGPLRADPGRPLLQQRRAALHQHQAGQGHVDQGPDRLARPLGQQARGQQAAHGRSKCSRCTVPGDRHGGFGERPGETDREQSRHRAPGRLNQELFCGECGEDDQTGKAAAGQTHSRLPLPASGSTWKTRSIQSFQTQVTASRPPAAEAMASSRTVVSSRASLESDVDRHSCLGSATARNDREASDGAIVQVGG